MGGSQGHVLWLGLQFKHLQTSPTCGWWPLGVVSVVLVPAWLTSPDFWVYGSSAKDLCLVAGWSLVDQEGPVNILIPSPATPAPCLSRWS